MNADRLARMKEGAILINVGRGTAVDTDALAAALHSGHLRGAGLDVTDPEPLPPDHPLWDEPGAVITPHNAGHFSWLRTLDNIVAICGVNLRHLMAGEPLDNQVARGRPVCDRRRPRAAAAGHGSFAVRWPGVRRAPAPVTR